MPFGLGMWEVVLILLAILLVFGPRRLPELGGALGKGIREFRRSVTDLKSELAQVTTETTDAVKAAPKPAGAVTAGAEAPAATAKSDAVAAEKKES